MVIDQTFPLFLKRVMLRGRSDIEHLINPDNEQAAPGIQVLSSASHFIFYGNISDLINMYLYICWHRMVQSDI